MTRRLIIAISLASILFGFIFGIAVGAFANGQSDHIHAWIEAENRGLIQGDPAYYYNGQATQAEVNHALLTAILTMDLKHVEGVTPLTPCPPGSYIWHQQAGLDTWQYVYATASPGDDPGYTRAVGFAQDGTIMYMNSPPPIGTYGPADIHVLCHG